jgi:hypothetical protein
MFKKIFGKGGEPAREEPDHSIEDLIVLERWDDAIEALQARVKTFPRDFHAHLRLADVYARTGKSAKALDAYLLVADSYTSDGFHDRAIALLTKVARQMPANEEIAARLQRLQRLKELEQSRVLAIEGLLSSQEDQGPLDRLSPLEAQQIWESVAASDLVKKLPSEQLKRLFSGAALAIWEAGEFVSERESEIERMFLIVKGTVEAIVIGDDAKPVQLRVLTTGDLFGERSLLEHKPWAASYRVVERARLVRLDRAGLEKAMTGNPDPMQLLEALRSQRHDREVAAAAEKLLASGG